MKTIYWSLCTVNFIAIKKNVLVVPRSSGTSRMDQWTGDSWLDFNTKKGGISFTCSRGWHTPRLIFDTYKEKTHD